MPTKQTLRRYGLSAEEWQAMYDAQKGLCPICLKLMIRANIDHYHIKGWKKLAPEERKKYVRGLICFVDNYHILLKGMTSDRLRRAADYLDSWNSKLEELR